MIFYVSTYKSGGVVIPNSLSIAKSLHDRVGLDNLILKRYFLGSSLLGWCA